MDICSSVISRWTAQKGDARRVRSSVGKVKFLKGLVQVDRNPQLAL